MANQGHDARFEKELRALGVAIHHIQRQSLPETAGDVMLTEVRFKLDADDGLSVLAIVKGTEGERRVIGFVGGLNLTTTLLSLGKRVSAEAVKWREDKPWGGS